jgi:hypothetical protein
MFEEFFLCTRNIKLISKEITGRDREIIYFRGAEGATTLETLRQKNRYLYQTLKSYWLSVGQYTAGANSHFNGCESLRSKTEGVFKLHFAVCFIFLRR